MTSFGHTLIPQIVYAQPIERILLIKLDHIGDFFISLPSFRRIREAFPNSHITLVCGPWNWQLAEDLGLFDEIRVFSFFPEQSRHTLMEKREPLQVMMTHVRFGEIAGGPYDLAVDFRYDTDTRRLLTMVDAKYRIGIGDFGEFPFLDVAIPSDRRGVRQTHAEGESQRIEVGFGPRSAIYRLEPGRKDLRIEINVDDPVSPIEIGVPITDVRRLGVGLIRAKATRKRVAAGVFEANHRIWESEPVARFENAYGFEESIEFAKQRRSVFTLGFGWSQRESFGVWTDDRVATLTIPLLAGLNRGFSLCLLVRGNTGPLKQQQSFEVACGGRRIARATITGEQNGQTLVLPIPGDVLDNADVELISDEFFVGLGPCSMVVVVETFGEPDLTGRSSVTFEAVSAFGKVLGRRTFSGSMLRMIVGNELDFFQRNPGAAVRARVRVTGSPFRYGVSCKTVRVTSDPKKHAPSVHQSDWSGLLADLIIRRFAAPSDILDLAPSPLPPPVQTRLDEDRRAGRAIIAIAHGSNKDVTMWPPHYYSMLINTLLSAAPTSVYLIGAKREALQAEQIIADTANSQTVLNLCGATTLTQLATLLKSVDLFIGNASGTSHLAAMSGIPTLTIHSGTNHTHQWGPLGAKSVCVSLEVPCRQCHILSLSQCSEGYRCMLDLTPDIVFRQAQSMLSDPAAPRPATAAKARNAMA